MTAHKAARKKRRTPIWIAAIGAIALIASAVVQILPSMLTRGATEVSDSRAPTVPIPFAVDALFHPTGWFGDGEYASRLDGKPGQYISVTNVILEVRGTSTPAIRIDYEPGPKGWAGMYWQYPENNWGNQPGYDLTSVHEISFIVAGETGAEIVEFKSGGIDGEFPDTFEKSTGKIGLSTEWQRVSIDLADMDTSNTIGAFAWIARADGTTDTLTFYIAELTAR